MSAEYSLEGCWRRYERYYHELWSRHLTDHDGGVFGGMHAFVERIAPQAMAEDIYPGCAHAWLFLRKGKPIQEKRLVYVLCDQTGSLFAVRWRKDRRDLLYTVKAMDSARWQRIVSWLELASTDA